jgi:hypothetical protein
MHGVYLCEPVTESLLTIIGNPHYNKARTRNIIIVLHRLCKTLTSNIVACKIGLGISPEEP